MLDNSSNNKRIAKNILFLYFRMIVIMLVSLYTSRVILKTLGVEDFGIYNLVGGITALFQFLNGTLADATQRYITYEIGKGNKGNTNKLFSICLSLHFILGILIILIAEPIGLWFLNNKLIIPPERLYAANWIFQFSLLSMFILVLSIPYNALIIAHENMKAFALISVIDAIGRLVIAFILLFSISDRLILYGFLILMLQLCIRFLYTFYCHRNFEESKYRWWWDWGLVKELSSFASWAIMGNLSFICVTQGISLLLGMFFLPVVNAARGIAVQVQNAVISFVKNFQTAINPQITKSYASGHILEMHTLLFRSSRFSFFLAMIPLLPLLLETETILGLWLTEVPDYTTSFVRMILIITWINTLSNPLSISIKATGNIREFELFSASIKLFIIPFGYYFFHIGYSPVSVFVIYLILEFLALLSNLIITSHYVGFSIKKYFTCVLSRIVIVALSSIILPLLVYIYLEPSLMRLLLILILSVLNSLFSIYFFGLLNNERQYLIIRLITYFRINVK